MSVLMGALDVIIATLLVLPGGLSNLKPVDDGASPNELDKPIPMDSVQGVLGQKIGLPCDLTPRDRDDGVSMVLWFKEIISEPLYSYDLRGRQANNAKLWSSPNAFGPRAFFQATTTPAFLFIDHIEISDEGIYRCRVDFKNSPTRNSRVNFTVIVPPSKIHIYDDKRIEKTILLGPYNEGSDLNLICEVKGGRPRPRVNWFLENSLLDDSFEVRSDGITVNYLTFRHIERRHLHARFICQASNNNLVAPETRVAVLDINLKPQSVSILTKERQVSADKRYEVECRTYGSRPDAVITWWRGSRPVKKLAKIVTSQNNQTLSTLTFVPVIEDDGKYLTCRAENPSIPDSALEDRWRLNVHYVPVVNLKMGSTLNPGDIKEGDDVYFECNIRANPKVYKLSWFHNDIEIFQNVSGGTIMSDHSLVLQSVTRASVGEYRCVATNAEGKGSSNPIKLVVRYAPVCVQEREELYGALKQETVTLRCQVDANPAIVTFHWTFNNSGDQTDVPANKFTNEVSSSRLNYTPVSDLDYGTLLCYGKNEVGVQKTPCVFQVVIAGRPSQLQNCTISNQTFESLQVFCVEGFDGGLPQSYLMEVFELPSLRPRVNLTTYRTPPTFAVEGLDPGINYKIVLYAVNAKGRSEPTVIESVTFKGVAKLQGSTASMPVSPLLMGLLGTVSVLATGVCLVLAALCKRHYLRSGHKHHHKHHGHHGGAVSETKHAPLESMVGSDSVIVDGHYTGLLTAEPTGNEEPGGKNGSVLEDTDPDIIKNQFERRSFNNLTKFYKPTEHRLEKANEYSYNTLNPSKSPQAGNSTMYHTLQCSRSSVTAPLSSTKTFHHKYKGPEVVTSSNRIQESCI
ncbi:nephrin isoform X2 [Coccinella septempunctata]|uniref:nephrin isoform X2 n=1 Tax=Coccinella septempunctata TaxID=41139 RepID=UPI001D063208|nr:nephrin isoform X2 [Coccinella septempunctata]